MKHYMLLIVTLLFTGCNLLHPRTESADYYHIHPASADDEKDVVWADYLIKQLDNRCDEANAVGSDSATGQKEQLCVSVDLDEKMKDDYSFTYRQDKVSIKAVNEEKMLWSLYQFIQMLGLRDNRFSVEDLPSPFCEFGKDISGRFAFAYRALYSPFNSNPELFPIFGTSNIDSDWAIWGHNLKKVVPEEAKDIYARTDEGVDKNQFCFTSEQLYLTIEEYIDKNYDPQKPARFCIMPNDNDVACQCMRCKNAGNTATNATPAVTKLIRRLAKRFPSFLFITSYYKTTAHMPEGRMPDNTGVIISAVNLPLRKDIASRPEGESFGQLLNKWHGICPRICIWDYNCNYDDFFTPFPCLTIIQDRLKFYRQHGVNGVVFNGAGYYYTAWGGMKNLMLSHLLINPDIDIRKSWHISLKKFFPKTHDIVIKYYDSIENRAYQSGKTLQLYGGIKDAMNCFLDPAEFNAFYNQLEKASKSVTGPERGYLNRLLTALNYTRIEIIRQTGSLASKPLLAQCLENLEGHKSIKILDEYRETNGNLEQYITYLRHHEIFLKAANTLEGKLSTTSPLDEDYANLGMLTDGRLGIPSDYHTNWLVNSCDQFVVHVSKAEGKVLEFGFLDATQWRIVLPDRISLVQNGAVVAEVRPMDEAEQQEGGRIVVRLPLGRINRSAPFDIRIEKSGHTFALDEIYEIK